MKTAIAALVAASTLATVAGAQERDNPYENMFRVVPGPEVQETRERDSGGAEMSRIFANESCAEVLEIMKGNDPSKYGEMSAVLLFHNAFAQSQPPDLKTITAVIVAGCAADPDKTALQILSSQ